MNKFSINLYSIFFATLLSCNIDSEQKKESLATTNISSEGRNILTELKKVEYNDVSALRLNASHLEDLPNDDIANILGHFYNLKADYYSKSTPQSRESLEAYYHVLKENKLLDYMLATDFLFIEDYYTHSQFGLAIERMKLTFDYIFIPKYQIERSALLYGLPQSVASIENYKVVSELEALTSEMDKNYSSCYESLIWRGLAHAYYLDGDREKAKILFIEVAEKSEKAGLHLLAANIYSWLALNIKSKNVSDDRNLIMKAIKLNEESGHTFLLGRYWRILGHTYFPKQDYGSEPIEADKAFNCYSKSIEYGILNQDTLSLAEDYAYLGWAFFQLDQESNFDKANEYYDQAILYSNSEGNLYRNALYRKMWSLYKIGEKDKGETLKNQIARLIIQENSSVNKKIQDFNIINLLKFQYRDTKIRNLETDNQLKDEKIKRQNLVFVFAILICFLALFLFRNYLSKLKLLKSLKDREIEMKEQNEIVQEQNEKLEINKKELTNELKSKLALLSSNLLTVEKIKEAIQDNNSIDSKLKKDFLMIIESKQNDRIIKELDSQFIRLEHDFYSKLTSKHPELTSNNIKMCAYLKMNLSSKEIASLNFSSPESVKVARSRLRKKMNIEPSFSISSYLNSI